MRPILEQYYLIVVFMVAVHFFYNTTIRLFVFAPLFSCHVQSLASWWLVGFEILAFRLS